MKELKNAIKAYKSHKRVLANATTELDKWWYKKVVSHYREIIFQESEKLHLTGEELGDLLRAA